MTEALHTLLEGGLSRPGQRLDFIELLRQAQHDDPAEYARAWAPSVRSAGISGPRPFVYARDLSTLIQYAQLETGLRFGLALSVPSPEDVREVLASGAAPSISHLSFQVPYGLSAADAERFSTLTALESLRLTGRHASDALIEGLLCSDMLPELRRIDLHGARITDRVFDALLDPRRRGRIRGVDLGSTPVTSKGLFRWLEGAGVLPLEFANFGGIVLRKDGARRLAASGALQDTETVNLANAKLRNVGMEALGSAPVWTSVGTLDVAGNDLSDSGVLKFLRTPLGQGTRGLELGSNAKLNGKVVRVLAKAPPLRALERFHFQGPLGDAPGRALHQTAAFGGLRSLSLWGSGLTAADLRLAVDAAWAAGLQELSLGAQAFGDTGVMHLATAPSLRRLRTLTLYSSGVGDAGVVSLAESPHLQALETLRLGASSVTERGEGALRRAGFTHQGGVWERRA